MLQCHVLKLRRASVPAQPGEELDGDSVAAMKRFLATSSPRVRAYGGARFDAGRLPAPEWAEFGAYTFVLPRYAPSPVHITCRHQQTCHAHE